MSSQETPSVAYLLERHVDTTIISPDGRVVKVKRLIAAIGDLKIHVFRDHAPPHFHVISRSRNLDARFNLKTLELIDNKTGVCAPDLQRKIQDFFMTDPAQLKRLNSEHQRMNS